MKLNILGTDYEIRILKGEDDKKFEKYDAYCNAHEKLIILCDMHTQKGWEEESEKSISEAQKKNLRHEIVHAFFNESGLMQNSNSFEEAWAYNEEMIDWIAIQGPKVYKAWQEADAL